MDVSTERALKYWFGQDLDSLQSEAYIHKPQLWFQLNKSTDENIKSQFSELLREAEKNCLPKEWTNQVKGKIASIIVFHQFSRMVYRGSPDMFKNDSRAIDVARELVSNEPEFSKLSLIEQYFVYLPLLQSESLELAESSLNGIERLANEASGVQKTHFMKYYQFAKVQYDLLKKFGRYPQRNLLLDRESTREEVEFLKKSKHSFLKSVLPLKDSVNQNNDQLKKKQPKGANKQPSHRILFLHGFRQNAKKLRKSLSTIVNRLKTECNAHVEILNGTHPYRRTNHSQYNTAVPLESQRVWFNSDENGEIYHGLEESIEHVLAHINQNGPYDGVIGFSQGGAFASILITKYPSLFSYFISISSFKPRATKYKSLFSESNPIETPSLHIIGKCDTLVEPSKSIAFSKCFSNSQIAEHQAGHFAPYYWPTHHIANFISSQTVNLKTPKPFSPNQPIQISAARLNESLIRYELEQLDLQPMFNTERAKQLCKSNFFNSFFENSPDDGFQSLMGELKSNELDDLNDSILIIYVLLARSKLKEMTSESKTYTCSILKVFLSIYRQDESTQSYILEQIIPDLFVRACKWKELILMCDQAFKLATDYAESMKKIYNHLIKLFVRQLMADLSTVDRIKNTSLVAMLTSGGFTDESLKEDKNISELAKHMPRIKSQLDKSSRIAHECANILNPYTHLDEDSDSYKFAKILSFNHYRKVLSAICGLNDAAKSVHHYNASLANSKSNRQEMEKLMSAPLSQSILEPVPEQVDVSSLDQMQPLYEWLAKKLVTDSDVKFLKGTVTSDGRLDLCKQAIGPQGVKPLLEALKDSKQVNRLLLGNNVIGDEGGKLIAEFIKSGDSPLTIWYIAGNNLTVKGITPICEALRKDPKVTALWLKRNPLKAEAMKPIAELFSFNHNIQVLDLLNCGLLDNGVKTLFDSIDKNNSLKHVYLSANGITSVGLESVADFYRQNKSNLETLFLGCNRIENKGAMILAEILRLDTKLVRFNAASNRIGSEGMRAIAESLFSHPSLMVLDLGYTRATMDLGELGNFIEDEGAIYLANLIGKTNRLISLNITHNHITQQGIQLLVDALEFNQSLLELDYSQFGTSINIITVSEMRNFLKRNRNLLKQNRPDFDPDAVLIPDHIKRIYSVYRTH